MITMLLKVFRSIKKGQVVNHLCEVYVPLLPKEDKNSNQKIHYRQTYLINVDAKILNKISAK